MLPYQQATENSPVALVIPAMISLWKERHVVAVGMRVGVGWSTA